jgi:hypothetical protein
MEEIEEIEFDWNAQEVSLNNLKDLQIGDWFSSNYWDDCWYEFKGFSNDGDPIDRLHIGWAARKHDRSVFDTECCPRADPDVHKDIRVKKRLFSTKEYSPEQNGDVDDDI